MNDIVPIPYVDSPDFSGLQLTRSLTGHIHSPFFTYDWRKHCDNGVLYYGDPHWRQIVNASKTAFAYLLNIPVEDIIVTEKIDGDDKWWRLGTRYACPMPKQPPKAIDTTNLPAIDI